MHRLLISQHHSARKEELCKIYSTVQPQLLINPSLLIRCTRPASCGTTAAPCAAKACAAKACAANASET